MKVLAIDVGTSSCKAGLFSSGGLEATASREYLITSRKPGYAEIDAEDVWRKVRDAIRELLAATGGGEAVRAVSFSSMGEAIVPVNAKGEVTGPSIISYDVRGAEYARRLQANIGKRDFFAINTNIVGPQFSLPKIMWLRDHEPEQHAATEKYLLWADYLGHRFGAEPFATDSLANRTLLLDVRGGGWSKDLLEWARLDEELFGRVVRGGEIVGRVSSRAAGELGLPAGALIVAGGHDQCCNALGCGCLTSDSVVVGMGTYETYCPVFSWPENTGDFLDESMNIEHHVVDGLFVSFLHHHSGLLVNWFRRTFAGNESPTAGRQVLDLLNSELPPEPSGLLFLPHNEPPQWPAFLDHSGGAFVGLKTATTRGEMFKALLEGITFFFVDALDAMRRVGVAPPRLLASGGGSRSDAWMQIRADIMGLPFTRIPGAEGSLNGAAILAAMGAGMFASPAEAVGAWVGEGRTFEPDASRHLRYRELLALYRQLYPALSGVSSGLSNYRAE